ncbi:MAG: hypothetical protein ACTSSK_16330 [Candidatus Heimdallarchaeota archaeon]
MEDFPEELCGLWIDEEGKAIYITKVKPLEFRTAIIFDFNKQLERISMKIDEHLKKLFTRWVLDERRTVSRLQIEAGIDFIGPTYNLYLSMVDNKPQNFKLDLKTIEDIRLYPEVQIGLYDDFEDDYGVPWGFPYKNYQKATSKIEKKFKELVAFDKDGTII